MMEEGEVSLTHSTAPQSIVSGLGAVFKVSPPNVPPILYLNPYAGIRIALVHKIHYLLRQCCMVWEQHGLWGFSQGPALSRTSALLAGRGQGQSAQMLVWTYHLSPSASW